MTSSTAEMELDQIYLQKQVVKLRTQGFSPAEIAHLMFPNFGKSAAMQRVHILLREAVDSFRASVNDMIEERWMLAHVKLEQLYAIVQKYIQRIESGDTSFDDRPFRIALMILDREAKLMGYDKGQSEGERSARNKWIDQAPTEDILKEARRMKLPAIEDFKGVFDGGT